MKNFKTLRDAYELCFAVGSQVRLDILEHMLKHRSVNLDTLAKSLCLTNGALTRHISLLEKAGLIKVTTVKGKRGTQKQCAVCLDKVLINITSDDEMIETGEIYELPLGLYTDFKVSGRCGLISPKGYIGKRNEPASFLSPFRAEAAALWFEKGFISFMLPPCSAKPSTIEEYRFAVEISPDIAGSGIIESSEATFAVDGEVVGTAEIKAPPPSKRGFFTPAWYDSTLPQYGTYKTLRLTENGVFLDGEKLSNLPLSKDFAPSVFSLSTDTGFIIFGRGCGDYDSSIKYVVQTK